MIRRLLFAVVGLILLTLPSNASATELPTATWNAEGTHVTVSGSCDAQANLLLIFLYAMSSGHDYGADCVDTGQGGHFSVTFPTPGDYPDTLSAGDTVLVWDNMNPPEGPVEIHVPEYVPPGSVPVPALGTSAALGLLAAALLLLGAMRVRRIHRAAA